MTNKLNSTYKTISEVVKILGLKSKKTKSIPTHTIRYWEKEFKQIKPKILNGNRRYYENYSILNQAFHWFYRDDLNMLASNSYKPCIHS